MIICTSAFQELPLEKEGMVLRKFGITVLLFWRGRERERERERDRHRKTERGQRGLRYAERQRRSKTER